MFNAQPSLELNQYNIIRDVPNATKDICNSLLAKIVMFHESLLSISLV